MSPPTALLKLLSTLSILFTCSLASSVGTIGDLTISDKDIAPDGYARAAVVVNNQFPGPLVKGNKGDRFQLRVVDQLTNETMLKSTSVHFHGIFQEGTNWADGAAFVNQCPIATGNSFTYEFTCLDQAGTFWYHSHLSTQYCDGLRGPMVVYDPNDPYAALYDVDDESTVITLSDWYHAAAKLGSPFPTLDSVLINGLGRFTGGDSTDLAVISVTQGKRYRFRLVSLSCDPNFTFSIDGHAMTVIEADAINHSPLAVDSIQIFAGQRYSFVLAADQAVDNYWIRALPNKGTTTFDGGINSAILRYVGAPAVEPSTNQTTSTAPLVEADLVPLDGAPAPGEPHVGGVDYALNLNFGVDGKNYFINGATFTPPSVPVLLQILSGARTAAELLPNGSVYVLPENATIELSFPITSTNAPGGPHPLHLHGHSFSVVRSAGSDAYNYVNPPRRDVVSIGDAGDNVTIRFRTNNPGPWFLHCHIDVHLEAGFAVVFAVDTNTTSSFTTTDEWKNLCPTYNALSSDDL